MTKECNGDPHSMCPYRQSDGRMFTDYRPRCIANFSVPGLNETDGNYMIASSYEFRQYLTKNASDIMLKNQQKAYAENNCGPCKSPYDVSTMLPEQSVQKCNSQTCTFSKNDTNGLGLGRSYNSDVDPNRDAFLAMKQQEQAMMKKNQQACQQKKRSSGIDANYYSFNGAMADQTGRAMVPSGAIIA